jgi:hypothetical protein
MRRLGLAGLQIFVIEEDTPVRCIREEFQNLFKFGVRPRASQDLESEAPGIQLQ